MEKLNALIKEVAEVLNDKHFSLTTAESCTGGLIASHITEIPKSSIWFERGFVTYSNLSKQQMLGVKDTLIQQAGAVSEAVAVAMADGALKHSTAQVSLAVTGIAGPGGDGENKPVGMVCFAWSAKGKVTRSLTKYFSGTRKGIRAQAMETALKGVIDLVNTV